MTLNESTIESHTLTLLQEAGFRYIPRAELEVERENFKQVILFDRLRDAVARLNPQLAAEVQEFAIKELLRAATLTDDVVENNRAVHRMLTQGATVEVFEDGHMRGRSVQFIDWALPHQNDFVATNQFFIHGLRDKIPDAVLFVNGLPLVMIELKDALNPGATMEKAWRQLHNYQDTIPDIFAFNALLIISDGLDASCGTLSAGFKRFLPWKSVDGVNEVHRGMPQINALVRGMLRPDVFLDLVRNFTVFEEEEHVDAAGQKYMRPIKKIAAYHQYFAVNRAVESTLRAADIKPLGVAEHPMTYGQQSVDDQKRGDRRAGVVWHTQGSGKSLSMVFYAGKIMRAMHNPTIVVVTDRNDLDDQLYGTFAGAKDVLGEVPVQAENRTHLRELLRTAGGGVVFTTMHKFSLMEGEKEFGVLSERTNIVVMADEAHRSQYGFAGKVAKDGEISYGFAKYLRDGLPNASFIGFTGTPIEKEDANTRNVFGEYIDIYDIQAAVDDGATVKIFYEPRHVKVELSDEQREELDALVESAVEDEDVGASEKAKAEYAQLEGIVGSKERVKRIAADVVAHFEARQEVSEGKAMIVVMSRRIAVELYREIIALRPEWHNDALGEGVLKVVMTTASSDAADWQPYHTTKEERKGIAVRFKDPKDELKLVIVRDMWLTGFDVPCMHTMYIDKPMRGANLMQAIARVNRVFKDKKGGLIVDFIGIASDLKKALATYTDGGGKGHMAADVDVEVIPEMLKKLEIVQGILGTCLKCRGYAEKFAGSTSDKLEIILEAEDCLFADKDKRERFMKETVALLQLFALAMPHISAVRIREDIAFFQAVRARILKLSATGSGARFDVDTMIRQIVDKVVVSDGVVDIFDAAGIKKPDLSILSSEFLEEIRTMPHKNIALETLRRVLEGEIRLRSMRNVLMARRFSEMLEGAIRRYQNNMLDSAQIIAELIEIAKQVRDSANAGQAKGLSDDEYAFYEALAQNESAEKVLGDDKLIELSRLVVEAVRNSTTVDWSRRESTRAAMRIAVKRLLKKYGYPPDMEQLAIDGVIAQAELFAKE